MRICIQPVHLLRANNAFTLIASLADSSNRIRTGNPVSPPGNNLVEGVVRDPTGAKLLLSPSDLPRHRSNINDNYCVVTGAVRDLNSVPVTGKDCYCVNPSLKTRTHSPVYCHVASHVLFAGGLPQKKGVNPDHQRAIKSVKGVSCVIT